MGEEMMESLFLRVLAVSAALSPLLLALLLGRRWLEGRYAPRTRWGLWLALSLVLLLAPWAPKPAAPVVVETPAYTMTLPVLPGGTPAAPKAQPETPVGEQVQPAPPTNHTSPAQPGTQAGANTPAATPAVSRPAAQRPAVSITAIFAAVWLAGLALVLVGQGGWYLLARRRLLRAATPVSGLERYAAELGLEGRVTFYHCKAVPGPMTLGVWHPAVLLPPDGLAVAALRHELYHVKRRDVAYKVLLLCACALHWFNPLVWLMYRRADRDVEACCDAAVVAGQDNGYRRSYGELLLAAAGAGRSLPFTTSFGGGKEQLKARLTQLFRPGKQSRALVCLVLALAVVLGSLVACRQAGTGELADGLYCAAMMDVMGSYPVGEADAEGEDYSSIRLSLLEYDETDGPHGKPLGEHVLPLGKELTVKRSQGEEERSAGEKGTEERKKVVSDFLLWPSFRNMAFPNKDDYLVLRVKGGEVVRMYWTLVLKDDTLYTNDAYRFTLQLPESWAGRYVVEEGSDEYGLFWRFCQQSGDGTRSGELFTIDLRNVGKDEEEPKPDAAKGRGVLGVRDRGEYWEVYRMTSPTWAYEHLEGYEEMRDDVGRITPADFGFLTETPEPQPLTENTMPTLVYYDPDRDFLLYRTVDTAYLHYGDTLKEFHAARDGAGRVLWRCDVSEDETTVNLSDVLDGSTARDERFYAWDIEARTLREVDSIPAGVDHMTHTGGEELYNSGFFSTADLLSNALQTADGTIVALTIRTFVGDGTLPYLCFTWAEPGEYARSRFLTPERIPAPRDYTAPHWGFTLHLPESLEGQYYVERAGNAWLFYDKAQFGTSGGFLLGLWAEDSETFRASGDTGKVLGEKGDITYTLSTWPEEDMRDVPEERRAAYAAMLRDISGLREDSLDLTAVTRSSGYLWPLPYTGESGIVILRGFEEGEHEHIDILAPSGGYAVQAMAAGVVTSVYQNRVSGRYEVTVAHDGTLSSCYGNLDLPQVREGDQVARGDYLGFAGEREGRWVLQFALLEEDTYRDPLTESYRMWDFTTLDREKLTFAGDTKNTEALRKVLYGDATFYNVETGEYCYADALPFSDGVPVKVYRFTELDMDGDTVPEMVLWLQRGDDIYQLGSIVLRYQNGWVYGYPMGYRSLNLLDLKADGSYGWSGGASNWGWGRMDFQTGKTSNISWVEGEKYYVDGQSATREAFQKAFDQRETQPDVDWYSISEVNPGGLQEP